MADILFDELKPLLTYFPTKVGKAEMFSNGKAFCLCYDGLQWCALNVETPIANIEIKQAFLDINLAKGRVVTTGLGFGLIQTILCQKQEVSEVVVYEKYEEIIEMFLMFAKHSKFDISKLKIINKDAIESIHEECDWLCMDHFEMVHQSSWEIVDQVREISYNCKAKNVMFWPIHEIYGDFCFRKRIPFNHESYSLFLKRIKISKLPTSLSSELLNKFNFFINARNKKR